ncbi:MAG: TRAP-type mannitol/chloroaromatic compound transport system substrate-binding protein, partial [Planctomycetota bacterium]
EIYQPFNVYPVPMGNTGIQMGGWFNKRIDSVSDLQGLRMRMPGLGGKVLKKAGGNPVLMSGGEIYTALERGIIDATEWVAPFHDLRLGLNRAARYYYYPGWHEPGTEFELLINIAKWQMLPDDLKKMVEIAAAANSEWMYTSMEYHNSQALQELKTKQTIEVLEFPAEVMAELRTLTTATLNEEADKNPKFKRVYEEYQKFQDAYAEWGDMTEAAYQRSKGQIK